MPVRWETSSRKLVNRFPSLYSVSLSPSLSLSQRAPNLRRRRTPRGDPLREQHLRPPRRKAQLHNHHKPPKEKNLLTLCGVFQPRIWKKQKLVCPMEFRSQAGKAWSRVLICRRTESISMSAVSRPGPSRKIHTQESFFWFRKLGYGARGTRDIEGKATRVGASEAGKRASFNNRRDQRPAFADQP